MSVFMQGLITVGCISAPIVLMCLGLWIMTVRMDREES